MYAPSDWWHGLSVLWKFILSVCGGLALLWAGWKPVIALWRWCVEKHDAKILRLLEEADRNLRIAPSIGSTVALPVPLAQIVSEAKRSEKSVYRSLRRLEKKGKVHELPKGWCFGPRRTSNGPILGRDRFPGRF
jgi:hypothetical protein